jgi:hypothetical protein
VIYVGLTVAFGTYRCPAIEGRRAFDFFCFYLDTLSHSKTRTSVLASTMSLGEVIALQFLAGSIVDILSSLC